MARLFLGVPPTQPLVDSLLEVQRILRDHERLQTGRWMPPDSFHLTLHFLGDTDDARIPAIQELAKTVADETFAGAQELDELIFFPKPRSARVAGVGACRVAPALDHLWRGLGEGLRRLDLPVEDWPLHPHVTLARFRVPVAAPELPAPSLSVYPVHSLALYRSHLSSGGSRYEILREFELARPPTP